MATEEPWEAQLEAFGAFLRAQRRLANLSLREMARRTNLSNAYLSQIERGLHTPSVKVLRAVARALDLSTETVFGMFAQAGLLENEATAQDETGPFPAEIAIRNDSRLTDEQKGALLSVYRSYLAANRQS